MSYEMDEEFTEADEAVARAIVRIRELFDAAPWLAEGDHQIGGCQLVTYADLKTIGDYAAAKFNEKVAAEQ